MVEHAGRRRLLRRRSSAAAERDVRPDRSRGYVRLRTLGRRGRARLPASYSIGTRGVRPSFSPFVSSAVRFYPPHHVICASAEDNEEHNIHYDAGIFLVFVREDGHVKPPFQKPTTSSSFSGTA